VKTERIRNLVTATMALGGIVFTAPAVAQAAPPPAPPMSWTGLYGYVGGGFGMWTGDTTTLEPNTGLCHLCVPQTQGGSGGFGRIGFGFDYQATPQIVGGVFADFDFSNIQGTIQDQEPFAVGRITQDRSFAVGARAGWLLTPEVMPFIEGGFTQAHFSSAAIVSSFNGANIAGFATPAFVHGGWFIGAGAETMIIPNWYLRGEYRYSDYGMKSLPEAVPAGTLFRVNFHPTTQTFGVALKYKFDKWDALPDASPLPATAAAPVNWTGFYVGAGGGYGMWTADTTTQVPGSGVCILCQTQTQGGNGGFGTIGGGFDYQFTEHLVAGVFGDVDLGSITGTIQDQGPFFAGRLSNDRTFAFGARAGYLVTPAILPFVDVGFTQAHFDKATMVDTEANGNNPTGFSTPAFSTSGWFVGLGAEAQIFPSIPGLAVRGEYRHAEYGGKSLSDTCGGASCTFPTPQANITFRPSSETFRLQLVYKLNPFR